MIITRTERKTLEERMFSKSDISEIEYAAKKTVYYKEENGKRIPLSREEAINVLGRENWIAGLCRSAFHIVATRYAADGTAVKFDSHALCN